MNNDGSELLLSLSLGDVVNIVAPNDKSMDGLNFLITYIDSSVIELISEKRNKIEIMINDDNSLSNQDITEMNIIARNPERGYARQNGLIPNKWVDMYFGGDIPAVITSNIIGIVEDQIELKTIDGDVIYIDFSYKGLPKTIPLLQIVIRNAPAIVSPALEEEKKKETELSESLDEEGEIKDGKDGTVVTDEDNFEMEEKQYMDTENDKILFSADQISFGDELESIQQLVDVPESEQRFTMESQIDDLINDMISRLNTQPNQPKEQLNLIKTIAERYKQLRDDTGIRVDEIGKPLEKGTLYKPIIDSLVHMNKKLYWILPVVKNVKKLYDVDDDDGETSVTDAKLLHFSESIKTETTIYDDFISNKDDDKYQMLVKKMDPYMTPFLEPPRDLDVARTTSVRIKDNITAIVDNLGDLESSVFSDSNYIRKKRFLIQEYNLGLNTIEINKRRGGEKSSSSSSVIVKLKQITEPDKMTIKSMLTLPTSVVDFSRINLPGTSILKRANLNQNFISLWRLLNDKTIVKTTPLDNKSFLKDVHLWERDPVDENEEESEDSTFEDFLNTIIPTSSDLFNITKDNEPIGDLSLVNVVDKLEPFLIYLKDISVKHYNKMIKHIELKIREFGNKMERKRKEFEVLDSFDEANGKRQTIQTFFEEKLFEELRETYGAQSNINDGEFLEHCIKIDNGRFLNVFFNLFGNDGSSNMTNEEKEEKDQQKVYDDRSSYYLSEKSRLEVIKENRKKRENIFSLKYTIKEQPVTNALISPLFEKLEHLRDSIIGQKDERKRYTDILMFVKKYTKYSSENEFWLYDTIVGRKIIPSFIVKIANAFINNKDYDTIVDKICDEQGEKGEDGDTIVDKHSGYVIKRIEFDTDEGFNEEGFKVKTRSVLEKEKGESEYTVDDAIQDAQNFVENDDNVEKIDMIDIEMTGNELSKRFALISNPLSGTIMNIINAMSENIGVYFNSETLEFIIERTINKFERSIRTKENYNKRIAKEEKKKTDSYEIYYNKTLLVLTLCYLLVTIQTSIPSIKPKKSFPLCKATFAGYPFESSENEQGMNYILCVAHKIKKNNEEPWKSIEGTSIKNLLSFMKRIFNAMDDTEIKNRMTLKREYELTNKALDNDSSSIVEETNVKKWDGFLPTISPIELDNKVEHFTRTFYDNLDENIRNGSVLQEENMNTAYGKCIYYSLYIQQLIKIGVLQNPSILKTKTNVPYLENSCCNDGNRNPLLYFTTLYPIIRQYMNIFTDVNTLLFKLKRDRIAPILFHPIDTKRKFTSSIDKSASAFSEETYYRAFYYFCKYKEKIQFSDEIKQICKLDDNDKSEFNVDKLKESGYQINTALFEKLMDFINSKNIVEVDYDKEEKDGKDGILSGILARLESSGQAIVVPRKPSNEVIFALLNKLSTSPESEVDGIAKELVNKIVNENNLLSKNLKDFLKENHASKGEINKWISECLDNIFFKIKDTSFLKHSILTLSTKLPNTIINGVSLIKPYIPKHWGLSSKHETNIKQMIVDRTITPLAEINNSKNIVDIKELMKKVQDKASIFHSLSKVTYLPKTSSNVLIEKIYLFYLLSIMNIYTETTKGGLKIPSQSATENGKKQIADSNKKSLSNCVLIIKTFVTILCDESKKIVVSYKKLTDKINESKETEKDIMTKKLNMLTPEARNVEKVFKANKMGKWGKGGEKGLRVYEKGTYDTEMEEMDSEEKEKSAIIDILLQKRLDKNGNPVDATDHAEMMDENEQEDLVELEELSLPGGENEEDDYDYERDL